MQKYTVEYTPLSSVFEASFSSLKINTPILKQITNLQEKPETVWL